MNRKQDSVKNYTNIMCRVSRNYSGNSRHKNGIKDFRKLLGRPMSKKIERGLADTQVEAMSMED